MLPEAANSQGDLSCQPNSLQGAIESTLQEARLHADQMEGVEFFEYLMMLRKFQVTT